ncbi:DUF2644 domain-containing protein [Dickeya dianthicola]|uniref:DUF2644 domain-containing protein n=1 Tax=Dickeya dianthicola TaxID=204039 RepID=A0ABX9NJS7_9GAMM|nr:DUF2644 domain-containing protein [Dickeya dianthicola]MCI4116044.1 DUF2644 domain-containing protein [Dickeya dianthicola]MCI4120791.1 DUF2644 domain-containing protein [Dickeya dianthicola]MCI4121883.1 DUF2644 domain-containing protein [Dickeya dianthicola]MCI4191853.1 DUF2644 domain-containing protein [Dickeya dianthicola]MCI4198332.1 DUF2644 domain-containing protein [Dickeya dianthicola]
MKLSDLVTNPKSGRLSTSDTIVFLAFMATTGVLLFCTYTGNLTEWLFMAYLAAWVTQSQASKYHAIKRDQTTQTGTDTNAGGQP